MLLSSNDYRRLITVRTDTLNSESWCDAGMPVAVNQQHEERVPNFAKMKQLVAELGELVEEYETSLGPA